MLLTRKLCNYFKTSATMLNESSCKYRHSVGFSGQEIKNSKAPFYSKTHENLLKMLLWIEEKVRMHLLKKF